MAIHALVTGGAGFIGSHLVDALIERGHEVTVFDSLEEQVHPRRPPDYVNKRANYCWGNILDVESFAKVAVNADVIFHLAALVGVGQSQYQIRRYTEANILGTANLLDILANQRHRCTKLIVAGSMSSYGEGLCTCARHGLVRPGLRSEEQMAAGDWELRCPKCHEPVRPVPTPESADLQCTSFYALTKRDQESMAMVFGQTYGLPTVTLRYFNVYGPRQSLSNPYTGVAAIFLSRIKNDQPPVIFEDGLQSRDFVSVHDVVRANLLAMENSKADGEVFNVGSGHPTTILEIASQLASLCGKRINATIVQRFRKGDVRHCIADISKIRDQLGYAPQVSVADGLRELIDWSRHAEAIDHFEAANQELASHGLA